MAMRGGLDAGASGPVDNAASTPSQAEDDR